MHPGNPIFSAWRKALLLGLVALSGPDVVRAADYLKRKERGFIEICEDGSVRWHSQKPAGAVLACRPAASRGHW
jgi:hypothetical protein